MSKHINKITLFLSMICLILGIRTNWREYTFRKASTVAKAKVISVDTKLKSGKAIANVDYVLTYKRDNLIDTLSYSTTSTQQKLCTRAAHRLAMENRTRWPRTHQIGVLPQS
jgi:hypothetical protein